MRPVKTSVGAFGTRNLTFYRPQCQSQGFLIVGYMNEPAENEFEWIELYHSRLKIEFFP